MQCGRAQQLYWLVIGSWFCAARYLAVAFRHASVCVLGLRSAAIANQKPPMARPTAHVARVPSVTLCPSVLKMPARREAIGPGERHMTTFISRHPPSSRPFRAQEAGSTAGAVARGTHLLPCDPCHVRDPWLRSCDGATERRAVSHYPARERRAVPRARLGRGC